METEGTTKAPKDKCCPYCGQAFTSSSLGRHLDLYIKDKNPKAPDGLHNVEEIRKLRGSITRRQPRGGAGRDSSAPRDSQAGSKRSSGASDAGSSTTRSPGDANTDTTRSRSNSQRVFNRQVFKSSLEVKRRVQDAIDTAKAAELALREMMGSWKAAKQQVDNKAMPFDFSPLSMDFPALCLQCLEPPPTLFSSTPHSTTTSWSITPPGEKQNDALKVYFQEHFQNRKSLCLDATAASTDDLTYLTSQTTIHQENGNNTAQKAVESTKKMEKQVAEHLEESFQVWEQLSTQRRQELWVLEMARDIGKRQKEVVNLREVRHSLKQENEDLKSQIKHLNRQQHPRELKIRPPITLRMDEKLAESWSETGFRGQQNTETNIDDRQDLNTMVSGAIEKWKNVIVTSRAANAINAQKSLDQVSASLKTPTSATQPLSPEESRPTQLHRYHRAAHSLSHPLSSPNDRDSSISSAGPTAPAESEAQTSVASTPPQSNDDSDEDADADADADVEMEGGDQYLSAANTPSHHTVLQLPQHSAPQSIHDQVLHPVTRAHIQHMSAVRPSPYSQRGSPYGQHGVLPSQQMHISQEAFGHQLQTLEHNLAQGQNIGWNSQH